MRKLIILTLLFLASMADSLVESVIDYLTWTDVTAIGIVLFAGLFIYTVQNSQTRGQ